MRTIIGFFAGLAIFALTAAMLLVSVRIYNYGAALKIESVVFRPAPLYQNRIVAPVPLEKYGDERIRNRLIATFVKEYLQVLPNEGELEARAGRRGALGLMCASGVMDAWRREILPDLADMAGKRKMRTVAVRLRDISKRGDYFVVPFTTKTWNNPNDLNAVPTTDRGREIYMKISFNKKIRETLNGRKFDAGDYMDRGFPPAAIFEFRVEEAIIR